MSMYVDGLYYGDIYEGDTLKGKNVKKYLKSASSDVDTFTYNRIVGAGFENLTKFQQNIIRDVVCELADFKFENKDILESVLNSYSINGVNMSFGQNWNLKIKNGIAIPMNLYNRLEQTGLCCGVIK